jgi:hypothetical protein
VIKEYEFDRRGVKQPLPELMACPDLKDWDMFLSRIGGLWAKVWIRNLGNWKRMCHALGHDVCHVNLRDNVHTFFKIKDLTSMRTQILLKMPTSSNVKHYCLERWSAVTVTVTVTEEKTAPVDRTK